MPKYLVEFTAYDEEEIVDRADCKRMANSDDNVVVEVSMTTSHEGAAERVLLAYGDNVDFFQLVAVEKEGEAGNPRFFKYDDESNSMIPDEEW
jgi:hypothetical protein